MSAPMAIIGGHEYEISAFMETLGELIDDGVLKVYVNIDEGYGDSPSIELLALVAGDNPDQLMRWAEKTHRWTELRPVSTDNIHIEERTSVAGFPVRAKVLALIDASRSYDPSVREINVGKLELVAPGEDSTRVSVARAYMGAFGFSRDLFVVEFYTDNPRASDLRERALELYVANHP